VARGCEIPELPHASGGLGALALKVPMFGVFPMGKALWLVTGIVRTFDHALRQYKTAASSSSRGVGWSFRPPRARRRPGVLNDTLPSLRRSLGSANPNVSGPIHPLTAGLQSRNVWPGRIRWDTAIAQRPQGRASSLLRQLLCRAGALGLRGKTKRRSAPVSRRRRRKASDVGGRMRVAGGARQVLVRPAAVRAAWKEP